MPSLSQYRRRVLRGESIVVEYYGSPVAVLKPYETGVSGVKLPLTQFRDQMRGCWAKLDAGVVAAYVLTHHGEPQILRGTRSRYLNFTPVNSSLSL